jgi:2-octaprenyl-6-methoxyphenol hydroxylase
MQSTTTTRPYDAVVVGDGPAGLIAALALAKLQVRIVLVAPPAEPARLAADTRTTALFGGSIELLHHVEAWAALESLCAPLTGLRIIDDTGALLRAPETLFRASDLGLVGFGFNVANSDLTRVLSELVELRGSWITRAQARVVALDHRDDHVVVVTDNHRHPIHGRLVVAADGRNSVCRKAAAIAAETWSYPQGALATRFEHSRPHGETSTEFHRRAGPLTTVPMPGQQSSLVWVDRPDETARLMALSDDAFARELEDRLQGLLGAVRKVQRRAVFPLSGLSAETMGRNRVALVGEAAHVLPPIGAQGLNLGFRDAAWLAEIVSAARARGDDIGSSEVLESYDRARRPDVATRTVAIDALNRSLTADLLPLDLLRGAGLASLNAFPSLRQLVMKEGISPSRGPLPTLLRPPGGGA